jgi:site-specific DNA-methyltransferase (adenine-specific)
MINIYNKDCMEAMALYKDNNFDLAIVDPPYGIEVNKMTLGSGKYKNKCKSWDSETPSQEYFDELFRVSKNQIIWGANYMIDKIKLPSMGWIYWDKMNGESDFSDGELAFTSFKRALRSYKYHLSMDRSKRFHPTQKPVKLYEWILINYAKKGDKILDTHLGSASIAIACHNYRYDLEGYEIDKDYYIAAKKRLQQHQSQIRMF